MEKAKTATETVSATLKEDEKTIVDEVMVELNTAEFIAWKFQSTP